MSSLLTKLVLEGSAKFFGIGEHDSSIDAGLPEGYRFLLVWFKENDLEFEYAQNDADLTESLGKLSPTHTKVFVYEYDR